MPEIEKLDIITHVSWQCPICGQGGFTSPEEAMKCRDSHIAPKEALNPKYYYKHELPHSVTVTFDNGFQCAYSLVNTDAVYNAMRKHQEKLAQRSS